MGRRGQDAAAAGCAEEVLEEPLEDEPLEDEPLEEVPDEAESAELEADPSEAGADPPDGVEAPEVAESVE